jgi:hypothetical protein
VLTVFTGPREIGKTVLLTAVEDIARGHGWVSVSETAIRLLASLDVFETGLLITVDEIHAVDRSDLAQLDSAITSPLPQAIGNPRTRHPQHFCSADLEETLHDAVAWRVEGTPTTGSITRKSLLPAGPLESAYCPFFEVSVKLSAQLVPGPPFATETTAVVVPLGVVKVTHAGVHEVDATATGLAFLPPEVAAIVITDPSVLDFRYPPKV